MAKRTYIIILFLIIILTINYNYLDSKLEGFLIQESKETIQVIRIVDGDTINSSIGKIRMLGINTPETTNNEKYSQEAEKFLLEKISNKTVKIEYGKDKKDRYGRTLAYLYLKGENINLKLVENGFANYYFPSGKDIHYNEFKLAWENCIKENKYLCEKSTNKCANCIELREFGPYSKEFILYNNCKFDCELTNWGIKDEGRKHFTFPEFNLKAGKEIKIKTGESANTEETLFWKGETYVWTNTGDTLFLRDDSERLVLWQGY